MKQFIKASALAALVSLSAGTALAQTEIQWWHSMTAVNGEWVNDLAKDFNASQKEYKIVPTFKGTYDESMTAAVAAFRAGNAPTILQVFEVGTATMMASKGAIVPVAKVMKDAGEKFDPNKHQAISMLENSGEPNTVTSVLQKGYSLNDRILRPALVMVAK